MDVHIQDISRSFNCLADDLSKKEFKLDPGCMKVDEFFMWSCGVLISFFCPLRFTF
jgi:hypothetical protein